ncbi:LVIVD repeat-containing protein [Nonomuraea solani]|uniref:LVIVD repeat-containing protein n=1 Tax=Nonomuraea solani TaxID=1144553 RepID=A0A1H6F1Z2_9ACTN|nr:hypothetical protein [Nonomuraea solani]SEH04092.1 LVIVD repeat-containing protein [Nonomuraea solani]
MRIPSRLPLLLAVTAGLTLLLPQAAVADHIEAASTFTTSKNMHAIGFSPEANTITPFTANSDLAFWRNRAYQGHYNGFRTLDISNPARPKEVVFQECRGDQGDIVVWDRILVRSWNSPAPAGATCDGQPVAEGFEGVHVFDLSNDTDPALVGSVETECGSHTATIAPDLRNRRLIVYSNVSSGCDFVDVIEVPIADPAVARLLRTEPLEGPFTTGVAPGCHDMGVIQGSANLAACASADGTNVFDIGRNAWAGGSLEDPVFLYTIREPGVGDLTQGSGRWHSASFTWDGKVIILGWEPGGGAGPRCTATGTALPGGVVQTDTHKSLFFYDAATGAKLGQWVLPRPQTVEENCTLHNYNVIPLSHRYVLVSGNYQSGISVLDFTDPARAKEIAYADPAPLVPTQLGGDWSTYWYNGLIYESDITRGLLLWKLLDVRTLGRPQHHLNPQTQETTLR